MGDPDGPPLRARRLIAILDEHDVEYVLVGGVAATIYGAARVTYDIDVVPDWSLENLGRLADALQAMDARLRTPVSPPVEFPLSAESLRSFEVSTWRTEIGDIDVIVGLPTERRGVLADYDALIGTAVTRGIGDIVIKVADLSAIIESKEALGRQADLVALPELHRLLAERRGAGTPGSPGDAPTS